MFAFIWKVKGGYQLQFAADIGCHGAVTQAGIYTVASARAAAKAAGAKPWNY